MLPLSFQLKHSGASTRLAKAYAAAELSSASVVFCADENVIQALGAAIFSISDGLRLGYSVCVYVISEHLEQSSRQAIENVIELCESRVQLTWVTPSASLVVVDFKPVAHLSRAAYLRLLLGEVLPPDVKKVIYLDCDIVLKTDLYLLWEIPIGQRTLMAARDELISSVGSALGIPETFFEYGLSADQPYLNSGVMVISLELWRMRGVGPRALRYLTRHGQKLRWADQDVLNAVVGNEWGELDRRWNVQCGMPTSTLKIHKVGLAERIRRAREAKILHFTGPDKPWIAGAMTPERAEYTQVLTRMKSGRAPLRVWLSVFAPAPLAIAMWSIRAGIWNTRRKLAEWLKRSVSSQRW